MISGKTKVGDLESSGLRLSGCMGLGHRSAELEN